MNSCVYDATRTCYADGSIIEGYLEILKTGIPTPYIVQATLIREIFGNPWKPVVLKHPERWMSWENDRNKKFAQTIYENKEFEKMPILADMLEEAGCEREDMIQHLRDRPIHIRGCWVLDLILGKE